MFDIGLFELLVVGGVGLVVIGPERLPGAIKTGALWIGRVKRSVLETRREIEQSIGADEIRRELRNEEIMASLEKLRETRNQLEQDIKAHATVDTLDHQDDDDIHNTIAHDHYHEDPHNEDNNHEVIDNNPENHHNAHYNEHHGSQSDGSDETQLGSPYDTAENNNQTKKLKDNKNVKSESHNHIDEPSTHTNEHSQTTPTSESNKEAGNSAAKP